MARYNNDNIEKISNIVNKVLNMEGLEVESLCNKYKFENPVKVVDARVLRKRKTDREYQRKYRARLKEEQK